LQPQLANFAAEHGDPSFGKGDVILKGLAQRLVVRVGEEALAQGQQGVFEAAAQACTRQGALLAGG
jgi:hypothetical protein